MKNIVNLERRPSATGVLVMLVVIGMLLSLSLVEALHNRLSLSQMLASAGIDEQTRSLSETQLALVEQIAAIYEQDDEVGERERHLLEQIGISEVETQDKLDLKLMFNARLSNALKLEKLLSVLKTITESAG